MKASLELLFSNTELTASDHPNQMNFRGILLRVDEASTKPPNGADGHRIMVPKDVAQKRLGTLIGMGLNYSTDLDRHAQRHKVGVITKAWISGKDVWVQGTIWKKDFPEAEKDLKRPNLGMSMEIVDVDVTDVNSSVWELSDFVFSGATILQKDKAAYYRTQAIAAKADERRANGMAKTATAVKPVQKKKVDLGARFAKIAAATVGEAMKPIVQALDKQTDIIVGMSARLEALEIDATMNEDDEEAATAPMTDAPATVQNMDVKRVKAAKAKKADDDDGDDDDDEDDDDDDLDASKKEEDEEDEDDEMESEAVDKGDLEEMGPDLDDDDEDDDDPGHLSQGVKNKGNKTTSEDRMGKDINKAVTGSALAVLRKQVGKLARTVKALNSSNYELKLANKQLRRNAKKQSVQITAATAVMDRRSVSPEIIGLLSKNGIDHKELSASGERLSVAQVDGLLSEVAGMDNIMRMTLKNKFLEAGLMDEGRVDRGYNYGRG